MPRKSLRPHLNQIRSWVRQGRTDAWIAHQLEVSVRDIEQFKRMNDLQGEEALSEGSISLEYPEEIDLRAEDDALIAAELEAAEIAAERAREEAEENDEEVEEPVGSRTRGRSRRGGRGRRGAGRNAGPLEGTFDHGEEGDGLWPHPAIHGKPLYAEYRAGHRPGGGAVGEGRLGVRR